MLQHIQSPLGISKGTLNLCFSSVTRDSITKMGQNNLIEHLNELEKMDTGGPHPKYKFSRNHWFLTPRTMSYALFDERVAWCAERFGKCPENFDAWTRWYPWFNCIRFRDSKDYEWYMLRWS